MATTVVGDSKYNVGEQDRGPIGATRKAASINSARMSTSVGEGVNKIASMVNSLIQVGLLHFVKLLFYPLKIRIILII